MNFAHLQDTDPDRLEALSSLLDAEEKVQLALTNLNWCLGEATEARIAAAEATLAIVPASSSSPRYSMG